MAHVGRKTFFTYLSFVLMIGGVFAVQVRSTQAKTVVTQRTNEIQIGASQRFPIFANFKGGATVAVGDVSGDGMDEYIVGAGPTGGPRVLVLNQAGQTVSSFFAYTKTNRDGINVAVGDLDGNGVAEIVTAPQPGSKPEVRVYGMSGNLIRKFIAFESDFFGGVSVAVIPSVSGVVGNIVVSSGFGREAEVKVFNDLGTKVISSWLPMGKSASNGVSVAAGWSDLFGQGVVVVGAGQGEKPLVQIYGAASKEKLAQWLAYNDKVKTGITVGFRNDTVVTGPSAGGGPDVRTFSARGDLLQSVLVFENAFRGGLNVSLTLLDGVLTTAVVPTTAPMTAASAGKKIVISLSKQQIILYEKGRIISIRKISSGKRSMPTPVGEFSVRNKITTAYSKEYSLYMENWMAFSPDGKYGLHSLPYWKLKSGSRLYEGASHIGTPVSHGCVRQTLVDSKSLFDWAPVGTPVSIKA